MKDITNELNVYKDFDLDELKKPVESDAVEFAEWKDKEYPCKFYKGYAKHNSTEWFTIQQLYEQFKQLKKQD